MVNVDKEKEKLQGAENPISILNPLARKYYILDEIEYILDMDGYITDSEKSRLAVGVEQLKFKIESELNIEKQEYNTNQKLEGATKKEEKKIIKAHLSAIKDIQHDAREKKFRFTKDRYRKYIKASYKECVSKANDLVDYVEKQIGYAASENLEDVYCGDFVRPVMKRYLEEKYGKNYNDTFYL